jgi:hypothetical protein
VPRFLGAHDHRWLRFLRDAHARFRGRARRALDERLQERLPCTASAGRLRLAVHVLRRLGPTARPRGFPAPRTSERWSSSIPRRAVLRRAAALARCRRCRAARRLDACTGLFHVHRRITDEEPRLPEDAAPSLTLRRNGTFPFGLRETSDEPKLHRHGWPLARYGGVACLASTSRDPRRVATCTGSCGGTSRSSSLLSMRKPRVPDSRDSSSTSSGNSSAAECWCTASPGYAAPTARSSGSSRPLPGLAEVRCPRAASSSARERSMSRLAARCACPATRPRSPAGGVEQLLIGEATVRRDGRLVGCTTRPRLEPHPASGGTNHAASTELSPYRLPTFLSFGPTFENQPPSLLVLLDMLQDLVA